MQGYSRRALTVQEESVNEADSVVVTMHWSCQVDE